MRAEKAFVVVNKEPKHSCAISLPLKMEERAGLPAVALAKEGERMSLGICLKPQNFQTCFLGSRHEAQSTSYQSPS
jgi:hypothetical protein